MNIRRSPAPLWFQACVAVLAAVALRVLVHDDGGDTGARLAFFAWIITIGQAIWTGIQAVGQVTLEILKWSVAKLWAFATTVFNGLKGVAKDLLTGFKKAWKFLEAAYDKVLLPAWEKFWKFFDRARRWLDKVFGPVLRFLEKVRSYIREWYDKYVRPVVDAISIARKILRVLSSLGVDWARALDERLAEVQRRIMAPIQFALRKVNEVINLVNRVVTADGLLQRLALVRSVERDIRYVSRAFTNWRSRELTEQDYTAIRERARNRTLERAREDWASGATKSEGYYAPVISEMAAQWGIYLRL